MVLHIYGLCSIENCEKTVLNFGLIKMEPAKHESNVSYNLTVYAFFRGVVIHNTY